MNNYKKKFIEYSIKKQALLFGNFKLKSGRISSYFFNIGAFNQGKDIKYIGQIYAKLLLDLRLDFDVLFGPSYKGIPIVISTIIALQKTYKLNKIYSFNRKEMKSYGEKGIIIGGPIRGNVIILDDVITAGTSIYESKKILKNYKETNIIGALVALDRQEIFKNLYAKEIIENKCKFKVYSIITISDIKKYLDRK